MLAVVWLGMPSTVDEFYASLSPKDRLIHELAVKMLKTRYDPVRTNAYLEFLKKKAAL
jgi:hypothetical protein